jgi:ribonuclease VapC
VKGWLLEASRSDSPLLICEINLGEVFYVIGREQGLARAEEIVASFSTLPIQQIPATWEIILQAARLKAQHALSYADCIAAASAMAYQAVLVTGDKEFRTVQHLFKIEWI